MLEFSNSPIAEVAQRQPALVTAWVQKYGTPLYITSVADYTADFQIPALRAGGVDPKDVIIVSADGNKSAYERIRAGGQYQLVTASEPYKMQAYQAIDELNRAFQGQEPERLRADALSGDAGERECRRRRQEHLHPEQQLRAAISRALGREGLNDAEPVKGRRTCRPLAAGRRPVDCLVPRGERGAWREGCRASGGTDD